MIPELFGYTTRVYIYTDKNNLRNPIIENGKISKGKIKLWKTKKIIKITKKSIVANKVYLIENEPVTFQEINGWGDYEKQPANNKRSHTPSTTKTRTKRKRSTRNNQDIREIRIHKQNKTTNSRQNKRRNKNSNHSNHTKTKTVLRKNQRPRTLTRRNRKNMKKDFESNYGCETCQKNFKTKRQMKAHVKMYHEPL